MLMPDDDMYPAAKELGREGGADPGKRMMEERRSQIAKTAKIAARYVGPSTWLSRAAVGSDKLSNKQGGGYE
jgi:hypothetical protein